MTAGNVKAMKMLSIASAVLCAAACGGVMTGCSYKGAKVVEGTDLAVGLNVPMTEGTIQLQVLNYLSGFRLGVDRNAAMSIKYTVAETNEYFGCVRTCVRKTIDASVDPCETTPSEETVDSSVRPSAD